MKQGAGMDAFARPEKHLPHRLPETVFIFSVEKENLDPCARFLFPEEPGGNHLGIIQDKCVPFAKGSGEIEKMPVGASLFMAIHKHHAGPFPLRGRLLCDQLRRQMIIEFG